MKTPEAIRRVAAARSPADGDASASTREPGTRFVVDLVIPVLNEAHVLEKSVTTVRAFLSESIRHEWRVVIVDNGSTDGTDRVATSLAERYPDVAFLHLHQRGRGRALRHAWTTSRADVVCYTDVDLSTELAALPKLVDGILFEGFEVATGSRLLAASKTKRSLKREFISRTYNLMVKALLRTSFSDAQCGFKAMSRRAVEAIIPHVKDESWFFDTELLTLAEKWGFRIKDVPVLWVEDDDSRVKIVRTAWDDIKGICRVRWYLWRSGFSRQMQAAGAANRSESYTLAATGAPVERA